MKLLIFLILILVVFSIILFQMALKIRLIFNSDNSDFNMTMVWPGLFIRALVSLESNKPILRIFFFNMKIFKKILKKDKNKDGGMGLIRLASPRDICVNLEYAFKDPFTTGILCGALSCASQFVNIDTFNQKPDFINDNEYIYLDATARVNIGNTLLRFLKLKITGRVAVWK